MATLPTTDDAEQAILDAIASYNVRPEEIVPLTGIHLKVQERGFRADEINGALQSLQAKGWIAPGSSSTFIKLTKTGYAAM